MQKPDVIRLLHLLNTPLIQTITPSSLPVSKTQDTVLPASEDRASLDLLPAIFRSVVDEERRGRGVVHIYKSVGTMYVQQVVGFMTEKVNFRLPEELLDKTDIAAEITHKNRTEIVKEALQKYLDDIEDDEKFKEAVVELYLDNQISFEVLKQFIGRQDAESVRASKNILNQGEELAEDLAQL
jgi:predicted DNA-binding protein